MASSTLTSSSHDIEKSVVQQDIPAGSSSTHAPEEIDISGIDEKKLLRKLDLALIPWVSCIRLCEQIHADQSWTSVSKLFMGMEISITVLILHAFYSISAISFILPR